MFSFILIYLNIFRYIYFILACFLLHCILGSGCQMATTYNLAVYCSFPFHSFRICQNIQPRLQGFCSTPIVSFAIGSYVDFFSHIFQYFLFENLATLFDTVHCSIRYWNDNLLVLSGVGYKTKCFDSNTNKLGCQNIFLCHLLISNALFWNMLVSIWYRIHAH